MCVGFTSCSKDDEGGNGNKLLIGSWQAVADYIQTNGNWVLDYTYSAGECIWTFDGTNVLINDKSDMLNGQKVTYTYNSSKKTLSAFGMDVWTVVTLTDSALELQGEENTYTANGYVHNVKKISFKKVQ